MIQLVKDFLIGTSDITVSDTDLAYITTILVCFIIGELIYLSVKFSRR